MTIHLQAKGPSGLVVMAGSMRNRPVEAIIGPETGKALCDANLCNAKNQIFFACFSFYRKFRELLFI